jgi:hypothetical protein
VSQRIWEGEEEEEEAEGAKEQETVCWDKEIDERTKAELFKRLLMRVDLFLSWQQKPRPTNIRSANGKK